jgi:hypothetical protein
MHEHDRRRAMAEPTLKALKQMSQAAAARRYDHIERTIGRAAAEEFEARWARAHGLDDDEGIEPAADRPDRR